MINNVVYIDTNKIREYFEKEGLPFTSLGEQLGRGKNFLSSCLHTGYMNVHAYSLWMKLWNMPYETFLKVCEQEVVEEEPEEQEVRERTDDEIVSLLKEIISLQKEMINMWKYDE